MPRDGDQLPKGKRGGKKATPHRTSKAARTLSWKVRRAFTDETAWEFLKGIRFRENRGEPYCPACGSLRYYTIKSRPRWWSCGEAQCRKQYSITSGTIFHSRKLQFDQILDLVFRFAECAKGTSACELGIYMDTSYSALWHNLMKLREGMASRRQNISLEGTIEMDAAWFGGKVRKKNKLADRKLDENDRRKAEYQRGKRVIMVMRQRGGGSLMFAADGETSEVALAAARELVRIDKDTKFVTDQELAYRDISAFADHEWVNHKREYDKNGVNTNLAEASFSRARRGEIGVYHHMSKTWMDFYAGEFCWREDRNRLGNLEQAIDILELALAHPQSRNLKGYYQHYLLPKTERKRPEARFDRVHGRMRARGGEPTAGAEATPDARPVVVQQEEVRGGRRIPKPLS